MKGWLRYPSRHVSERGYSGPSHLLRRHDNCSTGAFCGANSAPLAIVVIEAETLTWAEFNHRIVGTDTITVVALKTVATG